MVNRWECVTTSYSVIRAVEPIVTVTKHWWLWTARWQRWATLTAPAFGPFIAHSVRIRQAGKP